MANHIVKDEQGKRGPFTPTELRELWTSGDVATDAPYRIEVAEQWADHASAMPAAESGEDALRQRNLA